MRSAAKSGVKKSDFDRRYGENWNSTFLFLAHSTVQGTCCYCLINPSAEVHHVAYRDDQGAIAGREIIGLQVFPVCLKCHDRLHRKENWISDRSNPVLGNHNTQAAIDRLTEGYRILSALN